MRPVLRWTLALSGAVLGVSLMLAHAARAQDLTGDWHGVLTIPGGLELRIETHFDALAAGGYAGRLASVDQGPGSLAMDEVALAQDRLTFSVGAIRGRFEGRWDASKSAWVGTWDQVGAIPLVLTHGKVPARNRPQTPKPPYPYREEEVAFDSAPGVKLAGTLTLPPGRGPFPAAVMITGSGPQDRDETMLEHKPFKVLADALTRRGVAVLRFDDRGTGKSTGVFAAALSTDFAADASAGVAFLRSRPDIDPRGVGLIGHSEGGLIAPMIAAADPKIRFVVLLAGPAVPSREVMKAQRAAVGLAEGATPAMIASNEAFVSKLDDAVIAAPDIATARAEVTRIVAAMPALPPAAVAQTQMMASPWYKAFIAYDPRPNLTRLRIPVLAVDGSKDVQVVASQNLPAMREALKADKDATIVELPGLNHLFQTAGTGGPSEYAKIEETMAPSALAFITDWVAAHARR